MTNTRGLTESVVLNVGLRMGFLGQEPYSLMVVRAVATTAMAGPLPTWITGRPGEDDGRPRDEAGKPERMADTRT